MNNPLKTQRSTNLGLLAARLPLGVQFVWMAIDHLRLEGVAGFVSGHLAQVPRYMPPWFGPHFLKALPFAEIVLGVMVALGFFTRTAGFFLSCLLVSFLMITGVRGEGPWHYHPNFNYLGMALLAFFAGPGQMSLDSALFPKKGAGPRDYD